MARQHPKKKLSPLAKDYYKRYVRFSEHMHNAWMHYAIQTNIIHIVEDFYTNEDAESVIFEHTSPINPERREISRVRVKNLPGMVRRAYQKEIPESVFLNSISLFEAFISDVAKAAYLDNPSEYLLKKQQKDDNPTEEENIKLLRLLIESDTRESAIEKYIEEKLRGIFYGNPVDIFRKNKLHFNIHTKITRNSENELILYEEMTARRNVLVHNLGIVDRKYIRETESPLYNMGDTVEISADYLYTTLHTLNTIAKVYVNQVALRTTGTPLSQARFRFDQGSGGEM